jgi:hypothetical protein
MLSEPFAKVSTANWKVERLPSLRRSEMFIAADAPLLRLRNAEALPLFRTEQGVGGVMAINMSLLRSEKTQLITDTCFNHDQPKHIGHTLGELEQVLYACYYQAS